MNPPVVSVIIPAYNSAASLSRAIDSVLAQTYRSFEVIIIDDGSTDQTREVIADYWDSVRSLYQENRGPGAARNAGIEIARGQYLVFLDADDELLPQKLEHQVGYLDGNPEVDVVYSNGYLLVQGASGSIEKKAFHAAGMLNKTLGKPKKSLPVLIKSNAFPIHAAMQRKESALAVGGFDPNRMLMVFADWDYWYRVAQEHTFAYLEADSAVYHLTTAGISQDPVKMVAACNELTSKITSTPGFSSQTRSIQALHYVEIGYILYSNGAYREARQRARRAIGIWPLSPRAWLAYFLITLAGERIVDFSRLKVQLYNLLTS